MAYSYGSGIHMSAESKTALVGGVVGIGIGAAQIIAMSSADAAGMMGAPVVPQIGTNGQVINFASGLVGMGLGLIGSFGKTRFLGGHPKLSASLLIYGLTAFVGGWLVPRIVVFFAGRANRAGAAYGTGYGSGATPSGVPFDSAPKATKRNISLVSALSA